MLNPNSPLSHNEMLTIGLMDIVEHDLTDLGQLVVDGQCFPVEAILVIDDDPYLVSRGLNQMYPVMGDGEHITLDLNQQPILPPFVWKPSMTFLQALTKYGQTLRRKGKYIVQGYRLLLRE